jgi:hypothetical protein
MVEILSLKNDSNIDLKKKVMNQMIQSGQLDKIKAQLKSQILSAMEAQKK